MTDPTLARRSAPTTRTGATIVHRLVVVLIILLLLFPVYWLVLISFATPDQMLSVRPEDILPRAFTLDNYRVVLGDPKFAVFVRNSLIVATTVTLLTVLVSSVAGYSLARQQFRGGRMLGRVMLGAYLVPPVLLVIPMFVVFAGLHLLNTPVGLVLAHMSFAIPFCVWVLRGFFLTLPRELEDAGLIDGCNRFQVFWRIVLPLSRPGIVAAAMFAFLLSWNEYFYAFVFLQKDSQMTLPIGIQSTYYSPMMFADSWLHLLTASVVASIPVFILFGGLQRWMVSGMTAGAVRE